jgi:cell wall-associated NlpC family hydrolase
VTIDGIGAVEARIAQIQALISGTVSGISGTVSGISGTVSGAGKLGAAAAPTSGSTSTGSVAQSPEFASLLADAMATGTNSSDPLSNAAPATTGTATGTGATGGTSMLSQLLQLSQLGAAGSTSTPAVGAAPGLAATTPTGTNPTTQAFLSNALAEQGKPYVYGATAQISDPDPKAFDCSELTKWAAARAGVTIPDGATAQYLDIRDHGDTMTVQQALRTPGALLFHFSHEPRDLGDIPADGHVAISLGDGVHTIEARGHAYGTNVFDNASGRSFNFAGMIPAMA